MRPLPGGAVKAPGRAPVRLLSSPMIHTPGIVRWLRWVAQTDEAKARELIAETYPEAPAWVARKLLEGDYRRKGDTLEVDP